MKSVTEIAKQTGVSVRTLHQYDAIGLLKPSFVTESGYRYYDEGAVERLYLILLFRELEFPLKDIKAILDAPDYDRNRVLEQQIALLEKKRDRLEYMSYMARGIKLVGIKYLEFGGFDVNRIDDYAAQAKTLYGKTDAYKEYTQRAAARSQEQEKALALAIKTMLGINPKVHLVSPKSITRSEGKAVRVIDKRKLHD